MAPEQRQVQHSRFLHTMETVNQSQQSGPSGQSEQPGLTGRGGEGGLKETGVKSKRFRQRLKRGAAAMDRMRKVMSFLNIRACEPFQITTQLRSKICLL